MNDDTDIRSQNDLDMSTLAVAGAVAAQIHVVSTSSITLTTTFAQTPDGNQVLMPLLDWQIFGYAAGSASDHDPEQQVVFETLLPLDNVAFLIKDMTEEFLVAVRNLEGLTSGSTMLALDTKRVRNWLANISHQVELATESLTQIEKTSNKGR